MMDKHLPIAKEKKWKGKLKKHIYTKHQNKPLPYSLLPAFSFQPTKIPFSIHSFTLLKPHTHGCITDASWVHLNTRSITHPECDPAWHICTHKHSPYIFKPSTLKVHPKRERKKQANDRGIELLLYLKPRFKWSTCRSGYGSEVRRWRLL